MFGYHVPHADEAMLIAGGKNKTGTPFRVVIGHGAFVVPVVRKVSFLSLQMVEAEVSERCVTIQGITLNVKAVIAFKVGNDPQSIVNAAQRFQSDQSQMATLTGRVFAGHLRSIVGSMTVEQIIKERQSLAQQVLEQSTQEMANIGLTVDSLQIQSIDDGDLGYIAAMAAPHNAAIQQAAKIAQAEADQAAAKAQQESLRQQSDFEKQTELVRAQNQADIDQARAKAAQAGPLSQAQAQQEVLQAQTDLAQRASELREKQLLAEVVRPAEAEAEKTRILANADAERTRILAEAAASNNRVALDQIIIDQLPEIVEKAAAGLAGSNLTILNGSEGVSDMVASLVGQGLSIFGALRDGLGTNHTTPAVQPELPGHTDG